MSSEVILELVRDQSSAIDGKIAELVDLKAAVDSFAERLSGVITFGEGMYAAVIYEDAFDASGTGKSLHEVSVLVR